MRAERALSKVDRDYAKYVRKMNIILGSMDRASELYNARLEGKAESREEIARNALAEGLSPEFVQKITGLDIETITNLGQ